MKGVDTHVNVRFAQDPSLEGRMEKGMKPLWSNICSRPSSPPAVPREMDDSRIWLPDSESNPAHLHFSHAAESSSVTDIRSHCSCVRG